jgi:hypothetical protein
MKLHRRGVKVCTASALVALFLLPACAGADSATKGGARVVRVARVSRCPGQNAEVVQAVDGRRVYEAWIGCSHRIGFARSSNGGRTFGPSKAVPGSVSSSRPYAWDPALAVAPDGTLYVAYMLRSVVNFPSGPVQEMTPVVAVSKNHGKSFAQVRHLPVPKPTTPRGNWGDRDFVAVGRNGTVYLTWDYGPRSDQVKVACLTGGSCVFTSGDFNAVIQKSTDGGKTWTMPGKVSPSFPLGGVYSAPIVAQPNGTLDVLLWQHPTNQKTLAVSPGREFFTRSTDGGTTWSKPVAVGPGAGTIGLDTWWIDGSLAVDPAGNLYASWDTQSGSRDTGWLAWSTNGGSRWSAPLKVATSGSQHLVQVAAAGRRQVYVAWQTPVQGKGYATFVRRYSLAHGWTGPAKRVSSRYGNARIWPGDTFGLSARGGSVVLSWGSAVGGRALSEIYASAVRLPGR